MRNKKINIGLFGNSLEFSYLNRYWNSALHTAKSQKCNLTIFSGHFNRIDKLSADMLKQIIDNNVLDGILIPGNMLQFSKDWEYFESDFINNTKNIPILLTGIKHPKVYNLNFNIEPAVKDAVKLLVKEKVKSVAFIKGMDGIIESKERLTLYQKYLKEAKIKLTTKNIYPGDFSSETGTIAAKSIYQNMPDAIITSSDEEALGVMSYLQPRGLQAGIDYALIGIDNIPQSNWDIINLSTIDTSAETIAKNAILLLLDIISGKHTKKNNQINATVLKRKSTHIFTPFTANIETDNKNNPNNPNKILQKLKNLDKYITDALNNPFPIQSDQIILIKEIAATLKDSEPYKNNNKIKFLYNKINKKFINLRNSDISSFLISNIGTELKQQLLRTFSRELSLTYDPTESLNLMADNFRRLKIPEVELTFFHSETDRYYQSGNHTCISERYKIIADFQNNKSEVKKIDSTQFITRKDINTKPFIYKLIRIPGVSFGFLKMAITNDDGTTYESLGDNIAHMFQTWMTMKQRDEVYKQLKNALDQLYVYNTKLRKISESDELTHVLNRRGFEKSAENLLKLLKKRNDRGTIIFVDIDHLKQINDQFSHHEGDSAISGCADILKNTFRQEDLIGRIGGDEFVVMVSRANKTVLDNILKRLKINIKNYNCKSTPKYKLAFSIGICSFTASNSHTLAELMHKADESLYKAKKKRKPFKLGNKLYNHH